MTSERKQTQNPTEQEMTSLQQYESIFERVNDSVMIRNLEGKINFWNHSAEELYGWRKEEAIGRVSHSLLQTCFPKPLEEIESELVRNGLWEGKLVHTTRDGGRVVVESRWTVDPKGQSGAVFEINTRSSDYERHPEGHAGSYKVECRRQKPLLTSKLAEADDILPKFANTILTGGGLLCILALFYFVYYYGWTGERQFVTPVGMYVYFGVPALMAALLFTCLRLPAPHRINVSLSVLAAAISIYGLELFLTPSRLVQGHISDRQKVASQFGKPFDTRSKLEVLNDLRQEGVQAYPSVLPVNLLKEDADGQIKSIITIEGTEVLPLAGISSKITVLCNETGNYTIYEADEHGFHNPKGLWKKSHMEIVAVGDSYTHGWCVPSDRNFVALIRERYPATFNMGIGGNGPLLMLATIKEYARPAKPKIVLWFYFEGNDLSNFRRGNRTPLLVRYLLSDFDQGLMNRQADIDRALIAYAEEVKKAKELADDSIVPKVKRVITLSELRERLGLVYGIDSDDSDEGDQKMTVYHTSDAEIQNLQVVLQKAKQLVNSWGGQLYFVYLPERWRYASPEIANKDRDRVLAAAKAIGLPVIDIHKAFLAHRDPLALMSFWQFGHYNEEGNKVVANEVLRSISLR